MTDDDQRAQLDLMASLQSCPSPGSVPAMPNSLRGSSPSNLLTGCKRRPPISWTSSAETKATRNNIRPRRRSVPGHSERNACWPGGWSSRACGLCRFITTAQWDAHANLKGNHSQNCAETDLPIAGLLTDLKARGLLDSTLVIWGGEFGRMPVSQGNGGRDHNPHGFMAWMAGAGIQGGSSHGDTDEIGHKAVVDPVSVHDLHATMLHLMGLDHKRLTYRHNGRSYRLTDVAGEVIQTILA